MATNPIAIPRSSLDYGNFGPVSFGSTNSTTAAIGQNTYQPSQAPFAPVSPITAPSMSIPRPTGTVAPVVVSANPAAERTIEMVRNTNALSDAVNQQAGAVRAQALAAPAAPALNAQGLTAQQMAEAAQAQQDRRYANAAEVARINNISLDEARARIDRATAAQSGDIRTPEGAYYNPDTGRYSTDIYSIGRDPSFHPSASMGVMSSTLEGAYGRTPDAASQGTTVPQNITGTTDASGRATISASPGTSMAGMSGQSAGMEALPYQGDLDRLQRETDDLQRKYMEDFEKMRNGTLPLSESQQYQLDAIKRQFDGLIEEQKTYNENYTQLVNRAGVSSGRNRYAPEIALGQMKKSVDDGLAKIRELNVKAIDTMFEVKLAMQQENWKNLDASYTKLDQFMQRRQKAFQDMQDKLLDQAEKVKAANRQATQDKINYSKEVAPGLADGLAYLKKDGSIYQPTEDEILSASRANGIDAGILRSNVQKQISKIREDQKQKADKELESLNKDKRDLLDSAAKNSAPMSVINAINGAKTYAEAIQAGGDYLSNATGIIGEYNFYKRQEQAAGRVPVSFTEFQDQDANRKILAATVANAQGLTPAQDRAFNSLADKHTTDPLIKAGLEAERQLSLADQVLANPGSSSEQIKSLYLFVKSLDQNSAVKEAEVELAKQVQSVLSRFGSKVEGIFTGKVINEDVAKDLAEQVKSLSRETIVVAEKQENKLRARAKANGIEKTFEDYIKAAKDLPTTADLVTKSQKTLDDYYAANPNQRNYIKQLSDDPAGYSDEDILQILGVSGFNPVGGDTNPATVRTSGGTEIPVSSAAKAIASVKPQGAWGGQCGAFIHSVVSDYPYGLNGINQKEAVINVPKGSTPKVGDVLIQRFGADNKYGHVAVVNSVDPRTGTITLTESNYYDKTKPETVTHNRKISVSDRTISGYFRGKIKDGILA